MKLISFAIPSYNSQDYLSKCVDSLLVGGDDVEIIIVNDGSKDRTLEIAKDYEKRYPNIVKAVDKENGGHGSGVNKGLELATGIYYKVVDSDDWLDTEALKKLLDTIREHVKANTLPDAYIANFVYDKPSENAQKVSEFTKAIPANKFITWKDTKALKSWHLLLMHALYYKTSMLKECGVKLPEHTFYVDNLFAYVPFPYVKSIYYLNINLYHYFIGRADQSVTIENIVKRYDQQIRVMKLMIGRYSYKEICAMEPHLKKQMLHVLGSVMMNTVFFTTAQDTKERRTAYKEFWDYVKTTDKPMYKFFRNKTLVCILKLLPYKGKGWLTTISYKYLRRKVKLG